MSLVPCGCCASRVLGPSPGRRPVPGSLLVASPVGARWHPPLRLGLRQGGGFPPRRPPRVPADAGLGFIGTSLCAVAVAPCPSIFFTAVGALRITDAVMLVYCCLKWIYRHGGARAQHRCKSLPRGWHERGGCLPPGQGVPAPPGGCGAGFPVGPYGAHPSTAVPSHSHSPARQNENKMVIMLQSSSGKGSEADEKPYLRVRPLLLITRSEAVNSADTAITGNEPGPVLGPRLPGRGMGTGEWGQAAARLLAGSCPQPLGQRGRWGQNLLVDTSSIWARRDDFLAFLGRSGLRRRGSGAQVFSQRDRRWLRFAARLRPG